MINLGKFCPQRIGGVEEHSTLTTDMLNIAARSVDTSSSIERLRVSATLVSSGQADVTILAPPGAPAVPHNPGVLSVADHLHHVVQVHVLRVVATIEDSTCVTMPLGSINVDSKGSDLGKVGQHCVLVIWGQGVISCKSYSWGSCLHVESTIPSLCG